MAMRALIFALVAGLASAAHAQDVDANLAAARAMIERAQLGDVFEPVAKDHVATRHPASGLVCHFFPGGTRAEVVVFAGNLPRGEDVGCISDREGQATTLYATRYNPSMSVQQALADADAAIRHRFADAQPSPAGIVMSSEGLPQTLVAHYLITVQGERWLTSAIVAQSGEWIIKLRFTTRARDADELRAAELEANAVITLALIDISGR